MLCKQQQNASEKDIQVTKPNEMPADSVSCISWTPSGRTPTFAASDWDSKIRIYNVNIGNSTLAQKGCFDTDSPCLSLNWHHDEKQLFSGCTDGSVISFDVETGKYDVIGYHEGLVSSVYWLSEANALLTLSYDKTLRFWDPRQEGSKHVAGFKLDHKPFCSNLKYPYLAIGLSEEKFLILNLLNIQDELGTGSLNYLDVFPNRKPQIASVRLFSENPTTIEVGIGGNDGSCTTTQFLLRDSKTLVRNYTGMSMVHSTKEAGTKICYPVNSIGFHPNLQSELSFSVDGGGKMYFWNRKNKAFWAKFDFNGVPITKAEIDPTGKYLAYALGYDWARGITGYMTHATKVCVHVLQDDEVRM